MGLMEDSVVFPSEYDSDVGSFGVNEVLKDTKGNDYTKVNWFSCRERFSRYHTKDTKEFWFMAGHAKIPKVVAFFEVAENILELPADQRTDFRRTTNKPNVLQVIQKDFWRQDVLRRSLSTIFLRNGCSYDPDKKNFEEAMYSHEYSRRTKAAIMRFLFGFTTYRNPNDSSPLHDTSGWVSYFGGKDDSHVCQYLINPEKPHADSAVAVGTIFG